MKTFGYSCDRPVFSRADAGGCSVCAGMLARGDFAKNVAEHRFDRHGTNAEGAGGRYAGLLEHEKVALAEAIDELISLRTAWGIRNDAENALEDEAWDVPTSPGCCDGECRGAGTCEEFASRNG